MGYYMGDYYRGDYYRGDPGKKLKKLKKHKKHGGLAAMAGRLLHHHAAGARHSRRMRVTNVKALRRSMRRVQGFAKLARSTIQFTHHVKMKKHRRR